MNGHFSKKLYNLPTNGNENGSINYDTFFLLKSFLTCFCGAGDQTWGFVYAKQILYHLDVLPTLYHDT